MCDSDCRGGGGALCLGLDGPALVFLQASVRIVAVDRGADSGSSSALLFLCDSSCRRGEHARAVICANEGFGDAAVRSLAQHAGLGALQRGLAAIDGLGELGAVAVARYVLPLGNAVPVE